SADGGGLGAGSNAKASTSVISDTLTSLGQAARIESDTVNLNGQVSHLSTYAHSHSLAAGFVAVAISESNVDTNSTVRYLIEPNVNVIANRGIDVDAFNRNLFVDYATQAIPIAFIPIPINRGVNKTNLNVLVEAKDGAFLSTAPRIN